MGDRRTRGPLTCLNIPVNHKENVTPLLSANGRKGRAVAQAVSRWLPTAAARVRVLVACGVCGEQSGTGPGFLRVLRLLLPMIIPPIFSSPQSPGAGTIGLLMAKVPNGPNWTPTPTIPIRKIKKYRLNG
jgi:hypothetical protein